MQTKFRSKVDWPLHLASIATACVAVVAIVTTAHQGNVLLVLLASLVALGAAIVVWILASTSYEFTQNSLVARAGPFAWRIPLSEVTSARESRSVRSGPALSMDRVEIGWGKGRVLVISPQDKAAFLATLRRLASPLATADSLEHHHAGGDSHSR